MTPKKTTASDWIGQAVHEVTLPSGFKAKIKIPNLPQIIKTGGIPNDLLKAALKAQSFDVELTEDDLKREAEYNELIVLEAVVEPEITKDDIPSLPYEDLAMLIEIAMRQRDVDAVGHHIGGLETSAEWRRFRGLDSFDEDLSNV